MHAQLQNKQNALLKLNPLWVKLMIGYCIIGTVLLFFTEKGDVLLWLNRYSNEPVDQFFLIVTFLGHGVFALIISLLFLFKQLYKAFFLGISFLLVSVLTNFLKRFVFSDFHRPFWDIYYADLHRVILDAPLNYLRAFPSGHAMTVFALVSVLAFLYPRKLFTILLFIFAIVVSWSRVYLCQHFFVDIFWGMILGFSAACIAKLIIDYLVSRLNLDFMQLPIQKALLLLFSRLKKRH